MSTMSGAIESATMQEYDEDLIRLVDNLPKGVCCFMYFDDDAPKSRAFAHIHKLYCDGKVRMCLVDDDENHTACPHDYDEAVMGKSFHVTKL